MLHITYAAILFKDLHFLLICSTHLLLHKHIISLRIVSKLINIPKLQNDYHSIRHIVRCNEGGIKKQYGTTLSFLNSLTAGVVSNPLFVVLVGDEAPGGGGLPHKKDGGACRTF